MIQQLIVRDWIEARGFIATFTIKPYSHSWCSVHVYSGCESLNQIEIIICGERCILYFFGPRRCRFWWIKRYVRGALITARCFYGSCLSWYVRQCWIDRGYVWAEPRSSSSCIFTVVLLNKLRLGWSDWVFCRSVYNIHKHSYIIQTVMSFPP